MENYVNKSISNSSETFREHSIRELVYEKPSFLCLIIVVLFFVIGAIGNFSALIILSKKKRRKNSKYTLMLRYLTSNNFIALMGMLIQLVSKICFPVFIQKNIKWSCLALIVWRFFGLNSGCISAVMAVERWIALARPFTYQKNITYELVKKAIQCLTVVAALITSLPMLGFGVYFDTEKEICLRYRHATELKDKFYAYLFMGFGTVICTVIVACNFFVTRVLCLIGGNKSNKSLITDNLTIERHASDISHASGRPQLTTSSEEIRFAKLMTFLSISFVICWMPQMIAIPLALMPTPVPSENWFFRIADILMALHFTSDPYIYVLSRTRSSLCPTCVRGWRSGIRRSQSTQSKLRSTEQTLDYGLNI